MPLLEGRPLSGASLAKKEPTAERALKALLKEGLICKVAADAGRSILEQYEPSFDRCARLRIVHAFRSALIAERKPGRRPKAAITAAYESWRAGLRGLALYKRHIPKFDGMSRWRRKAEQQRLMDAIHSRHRRVRRVAVYYI